MCAPLRLHVLRWRRSLSFPYLILAQNGKLRRHAPVRDCARLHLCINRAPVRRVGGLGRRKYVQLNASSVVSFHRFLSLADNVLTGTVPSTVSILSNLVYVSRAFVSCGAVVMSPTACSSFCRYLKLAGNALYGSIPEAISTLTNLQYDRRSLSLPLPRSVKFSLSETQAVCHHLPLFRSSLAAGFLRWRTIV